MVGSLTRPSSSRFVLLHCYCIVLEFYGVEVAIGIQMEEHVRRVRALIILIITELFDLADLIEFILGSTWLFAHSCNSTFVN